MLPKVPLQNPAQDADIGRKVRDRHLSIVSFLLPWKPLRLFQAWPPRLIRDDLQNSKYPKALEELHSINGPNWRDCLVSFVSRCRVLIDV